METKRIPLSTILATRDASVDKDGLLVNCYAEQGPDAKRIVKRPGLSLFANLAGPLCPGQGAFFFIGGPVFVTCDTLYTNISPTPPCVLGISVIITSASDPSGWVLGSPADFFAPVTPGFVVICRPLQGQFWVWRYKNPPSGNPFSNVTCFDATTATIVREFNAVTHFGGDSNAKPSAVDPGDSSVIVGSHSSNRIYKGLLDGTVYHIDTTTRFPGDFYGYLLAPAWNLGAQFDLWASDGNRPWRVWDIAWTIGGMTPFETMVPSSDTSLWRGWVRNGAGVGSRVYYMSSDNSIRYANTTTCVETIVVPGSAGLTNQNAVLGFDGNLYATSGSTLRKYSMDGALLASLFVPGADTVFLYDTKGFVWTNHLTDDPAKTVYAKIKASTMEIVATVQDTTHGSFHIVGEPLSGVPIVDVAPVFGGTFFGGVGKIDCL